MHDEPALVQRAKKLDPEALTTIFDRHALEVYNYVYFLCHDEEEADTIVGDTFDTLLEQFSSGKGPDTSLRLCIFQIAYSSVMDHAHHMKHVMDMELVIEGTFSRRVTLNQTQSDESALLRELLFAMHHDLSEIQRHALILRFLVGFTLPETAAIIGKKVDQVKVIQNSAVRRLRVSLCL